MTKARDLANAADVLDDVSATELSYVNGVTSAIQTQLNNKQAVVANVNDTEIGYLDGVTSAIQTQIDGKSSTSHNHNSTYVANSLVDAKGDLLVGSANDTVSRLAVASTAGYVLTVDSAEATGLKWGAPGSSFVGCSLTTSSAPTMSNGTWTAITFNSEQFDTDGFHSTSTNNTRITIPTGKGGYYLLTALGNFNSNSGAGTRYITFGKNGSTIAQAQVGTTPVTDKGLWMKDVYIINLAAGDYVEFFQYQASGGNMVVEDASSLNFQCQFLGA